MVQTTIVETKTKSKVGIYTAVAVVLISSAFALFFIQGNNVQQDQGNYIIIGDTKIDIELASTSEERTMGLSNREVLDQNTGLLFTYDQNLVPRFWMKNMNFSIDIIWIKNNTVVGYEKYLLPEGEDPKTVYYPQTFVNRVLEVNAGFVDKNGIRIGDEIQYTRYME